MHGAAVDGDTLPVRVVQEASRGLLSGRRGLDLAADQGVLAVGAHDQPCGLGHGLPAGRPAPDAGDDAVPDGQPVDSEALADLGAGGSGRVHEDRVEDRATRAVERVDPVMGRVPPLEADRSGVERELPRGGGPRRDDRVE